MSEPGLAGRYSRSRWLVIGLLAAAAVCGFGSKAEAGSAVAILALAAMPALFAVPPRGRPVVAAAILAAAVLVAVTAGLDDPLAWAAVVLVAAAGMLMALRGPTWPQMAARYEDSGEPTGMDHAHPEELWKALDRGEDPTDAKRTPES